MELMDRKNKHEIIELLSTLKLYLEADLVEENPSATIDNTLKVCDDSCRRHFSEFHYGEYGDIFQSLMQIFSQLDWEKTNAGEKHQIFRLAVEILEGLIDKFQKDKRDIKKEIVFLPYKASMWDCMDTVWQAAYEDKNSCNVYVVPIPYCTLTPEMKVDEWHCEDNLPEYVPITHWQDMDLEKLHPDVIVVHNPYDGCNAVTSVDNRYWSNKLKKYTDRLIYIPYYTASNTASVDIIKSPGIANADYVVLDNENIKRQYERCYKKGSYPADKFVALGSPKVERALKTKKSDVPLPDAWEKIVGNKPVILYNTSLGTALRSSEYVCDKLRVVFQKYKNQKDIAFWWRPHPLMKDTLKRLRPNIYDEYCAIEKEYVREGWGIYDDTPDMDRAIVWGDCYYGDPSGVLNTYMETGKLVVEQCIKYTTDRKPLDISVWGKAFCRVGDTVWLVHGKLNILLKYEISSGKLSYITKIGLDTFADNQYTEMCCIHNKLYIIPALAKSLLCYDIGSGELSTIDFPKQVEYSGAVKFCGACCINDKIYCVPTMYPYMLCINGVTGTVEWTVDIEKIQRDDGIAATSYLQGTAVYKKRYLVSIISKTNRLLITDTEERTCKIMQLGNHSYNSIAIIDEMLLLGCAKEHGICCYSMEDFSFKYMIKDGLHVIRQFDDDKFIMDNNDRKGWKIVDADMKVVYENAGDEPGDTSAMMDDYMRVVNAVGHNISIDTNTNRMYIWDKGITVKLSLTNAEKFNESIFTGQQICYEYPGMDIEVMMKKNLVKTVTKLNIGENIYNKLIK